ncbi:MAG: N-formylglutamate deformylase [Pseudomonadota bacterium]
MTRVHVREGHSAVVMAFPHSGTYLPDDVRCDLNETGLQLSDTDWHLPQLYEGLLLSATTVQAEFHRYVIDANRDPSGKSLYPGQATTGLIPETDFDGNPLWIRTPNPAQMMQRQVKYHEAYHRTVRAALHRARDTHGFAVLYECHSIRSQVPRLFDGTLPDFNIGTFNGRSCDPRLARDVEAVCRDARGFTCVVNGRFKGGWTTRHYGRPDEGIHAIQMELAQSTHLETETSPWAYSRDKAQAIRTVLDEVLWHIDQWRPK